MTTLADKLQLIRRPRPENLATTLGVQTSLVEVKSINREESDYLVIVEHLPIYTRGRGDKEQVVADQSKHSVPWLELSRGGQATYHGPGQMVVYPIFDLTRHGQDVHIFLRRLEKVGCELLKQFGIKSEVRNGLTGVWVKSPEGDFKKIISIGIGVRKWISYHGMAINIAPDLEYFRAISVCGQDGSTVSSMSELLGKQTPSWEAVEAVVVKCFNEEFGFNAEVETTPVRPNWLKARAPGSPEYLKTREIVKDLKLHTVCEEARCPNIGECWTHHTATFMIMGDLCTRRCSFCSVKDGALENLSPLDVKEPIRVAQAVKHLGLKHIVITSVNRDDLPDMGAAHFSQTVRSIRATNPDCDIELLIPDMRGDRVLVETILESGFVKVLNHNVETVPRLYRRVRPGAQFSRSLNILRWAKEAHPQVRTKSGVMVGLGEEFHEVLSVMDALREIGVQILTIGQYLQPTKDQLAVARYVTPEEFASYKEEGLKRGFSHVESAPFVRSSYHAWKHSADKASPYEFKNEIVEVQAV